VSVTLITRSNRIDNFQKLELIEIGIPSADPPNAVLAHENCGMRIVQQVAGEVRQLQNDLFGDVSVPLGRDKDSETRRGEERRHKFPTLVRSTAAASLLDGL
jgi:hypothetical protein